MGSLHLTALLAFIQILTVKMMKIGDVFPNFYANTTNGKMKFHEYLAGSWGILLSYPADYTPVSTTELGKAMKLEDEFEKRNVKVVAISCDSLDDHNRWLKDVVHIVGLDAKFPYPIIADVNRNLAVKLGLVDPDEIDRSKNQEEKDKSSNAEEKDKSSNAEEKDKSSNQEVLDKSRSPGEKDKSSNVEEKDKCSNAEEKVKSSNQEVVDKSNGQEEKDKNSNAEEKDKSRNSEEKDKSSNQEEKDKSSNQEEKDKSSNQEEKDKSSNADEKDKKSNADEKDKKSNADEKDKKSNAEGIDKSSNTKAKDKRSIPEETNKYRMPLTSRAVFIIGPDKKLKLSMFYPVATGTNFDEIVRVIDSLQLTAVKKVVTPVNWKQGGKCLIDPSLSDGEAKELFPSLEKFDVPSGKGYYRSTEQPK